MFRGWYSQINIHFLEHGFIRSKRETTLHSKRVDDGNFIMVCVYIDAGSLQGTIDKFKCQIEFEMFNLGVLHYFLGLEVK